jgi:hypothetical protein
MTSTLKLYAIIGLLVAAAVGIGIVYAKGRLDASHAAQLSALQARLNTLATQTKQLEDIQRKDQLQAMQDAEDKERLNALIDSQGALLANPHDGCLTADDVERVRSVFQGGTTTAP